MARMIAHHEQALAMTAMVRERTAREDILRLARRIEAAQSDEIAWMERWLRARGEPTEDPAPSRHRVGIHAEHAEMPGMLTDEELQRLEAASGVAFDRRFLEAMIFHHQGAIAMVEELFSSSDGGQDGETFAFAAHVESDQRIEIARMRGMLASGS